MEEEMVACLLLLTLPESFNIVVTAIETLADDKITVDFVKRRLLDEEIKRMSNKEEAIMGNVSEGEQGAAAFQSKGIWCYYCKKPGHKKIYCRKFKADQAKTEQVNFVSDEFDDHVVFLFDKSKNSWNKRGTISFYLDSGATDHMINDCNLFCRSKLLGKKIVIGVAKARENLIATHIGEIDCLHSLN